MPTAANQTGALEDQKHRRRPRQKLPLLAGVLLLRITPRIHRCVQLCLRRTRYLKSISDILLDRHLQLLLQHFEPASLRARNRNLRLGRTIADRQGHLPPDRRRRKVPAAECAERLPVASDEDWRNLPAA